MASDFNKILYHEIEEHIKRQLGDNKLNKQDHRRLMDQVMERFAKSLVAIVASVEMAQREAAEKAKADEVAARNAAAAAAIVESSEKVAGNDSATQEIVA